MRLYIISILIVLSLTGYSQTFHPGNPVIEINEDSTGGGGVGVELDPVWSSDKSDYVSTSSLGSLSSIQTDSLNGHPVLGQLSFTVGKPTSDFETGDELFSYLEYAYRPSNGGVYGVAVTVEDSITINNAYRLMGYRIRMISVGGIDSNESVLFNQQLSIMYGTLQMARLNIYNPTKKPIYAYYGSYVWITQCVVSDLYIFTWRGGLSSIATCTGSIYRIYAWDDANVVLSNLDLSGVNVTVQDNSYIKLLSCTNADNLSQPINIQTEEGLITDKAYYNASYDTTRTDIITTNDAEYVSVLGGNSIGLGLNVEEGIGAGGILLGSFKGYKQPIRQTDDHYKMWINSPVGSTDPHAFGIWAPDTSRSRVLHVYTGNYDSTMRHAFKLDINEVGGADMILYDSGEIARVTFDTDTNGYLATFDGASYFDGKMFWEGALGKNTSFYWNAHSSTHSTMALHTTNLDGTESTDGSVGLQIGKNSDSDLVFQFGSTKSTRWGKLSNESDGYNTFMLLGLDENLSDWKASDAVMFRQKKYMGYGGQTGKLYLADDGTNKFFEINCNGSFGATNELGGQTYGLQVDATGDLNTENGYAVELFGGYDGLQFNTYEGQIGFDHGEDGNMDLLINSSGVTVNLDDAGDYFKVSRQGSHTFTSASNINKYKTVEFDISAYMNGQGIFSDDGLRIGHQSENNFIYFSPDNNLMIIEPEDSLAIRGKVEITNSLNYFTGSLTDGTPTNAEIDAILGSSQPAGYVAWVKDTDGTGLIYQCTSDGTDWFYVVTTKAL